MRRLLFDSDGVLRPVILVGLLVLVPLVVLALASWGSWVGLALIAVILTAGLVLMMRVKA
ncbi:hypothetical protein SK571_03565 [Lentzea sp. BCCO 10_0798]|uniref:Uncharacterized protein n=1 Tax=Lentzea kristufekii TaxID=3095430 RepID=A0ABU4TK19_9PSEU|nr:hypothetical protein [Lentzea sp. BCCO 10_0798]MDX8048449.1 hypothetical protein [Lentzea sp. BCCO 10_0798]